jgi:hypothetical protein
MGIACASGSICYAFGITTGGSNYILSTATNSIIWVSNPIPNVIGNIRSMDCPSADICYFAATAQGTYQIQIYNTIPGSNLWVVNSVSANAEVGADGQLNLECPTVSLCFAFDPTSLGSSPLLVNMGATDQWEQISSSDFTQINSIVELSSTMFLIVGFGSNGTGITFSTLT